MTFSNEQAGPQSPFHTSGPPQAPLFVRDRYGSADSTATIDSLGKDEISEDDSNPWATTMGNEPVVTPETTVTSETKIPRADSGFKAYSILAGAFVFEALIWGFPLCYGVFQSHYYTSPSSPFKDNTSTSYIGTIGTGIFFLGAPLMTYLVEKLPQYRRMMICIGWPLCIAALLGGSFATTIPALIGTQGILYAVGELILYLPLMSIINEYFIEKRGLAFGIVTCSSAVAGIALPFLAEGLLTKLGYATTLRIFALVLAVTTGPLLLLLKPRLTDVTPPASISLSFIRKPLFWLYSLSNTAHSISLFLPALFLPQFSLALGLSSTLGALLLALLSVSQILGQISFGFLSDRSASSTPRLRIPLNVLILLSSLIAALSAFTLWGLARGLSCLIPFAILFGFFANGYTVLWPRMGMVLASPEQAGDSSSSDEKAPPTTAEAAQNSTAILTSFGLFSFQKGLGALVAGPIATKLLGLHFSLPGTGDGKVGYGGTNGQFTGIVLLTGCACLVSALLVAAWYILPKRFRA